MWRMLVVVTVAVVVGLGGMGCGGSGDASSEETQAAEPVTTESAAADPAGGDWTTVATVKSTHPQEMEGILISEPFEAACDVQLVLDMPKGGKLDGVIGVIIPADMATDASAILDAIPDGATVTLIPSKPTEVVSDLDAGTYVFVNSVPTEKAWTLEIQTKD